MANRTAEWEAACNRHRPALLQWASSQLPGWARARVDPDDLVQHTLLEAVRETDWLLDRPDNEAAAYLRRMLTNNVIDAARKFARSREDVSIDAVEDSSRRLADWLAADDTSPSERAARSERFARLAQGLARLPDAQRLAIEMRYFRRCKVAEIARRLERSEEAVSSLLHRAVIALRADLGPLDL